MATRKKAVEAKAKQPEAITQAPKKYELVLDDSIEVFGTKLYRIRALIAFGAIAVGQLGGYVQSEANLAQVSGNAWVSGDAQVYGDAWVSGDARVYGDARVSGDAQVYGDAAIFWASRVGSEQGTLTVYRAKEGLLVTRGCFLGSDVEFLKAVASRHGAESKIGREYALLIEVARSRISQ